MRQSKITPRTCPPRRARVVAFAAVVGTAVLATVLTVAELPAGPVAAAASTSARTAHPTSTTAPSGSTTTTTTTPHDLTWSIQPSTARGPTGRPSFTYTNVIPGGRLRSYVGVTNYSSFPVTFAVYAADGVNTPSGGFDVLPAGKKSVGVGAWTTLARDQVTIPAGLEENIPFSIAVPADATPGDHFGGIVAQVSTSSTSANGPKFLVNRRVVTRIYLRVAGKLHPALSVQKVGIAYHGTIDPVASGSATVDYTVKNTGNVALASPQVISVTSLFGTLATVDGQPLLNLLPGQSAHFRLALDGIPPAGPITAHVMLVPGEPKGTTTPPIAKLGSPAVVSAASGSTWAWPWPQFVLLLLLLGLLWLWRRRRRRRGRKQAAAVAAAKEEGRLQAEAELKDRQVAEGDVAGVGAATAATGPQEPTEP